MPRCRGFLYFCTRMGSAQGDCRAGWAWHGPPGWGLWATSDSTSKPAPRQGAQPSQGPPSLPWGNVGWRKGGGGGTDVPVTESLTPSREPSAYTKGDQLPWPGLGWHPSSGAPPRPCRGSGHAIWGRNASFCQRLCPPSRMARVLVELFARCMLLLAQPGHGPPQPCTPGCPQHPLCPCSCVPPPPPPQHPPSTSARHSTRSPSPPWGARRGASSPLPAWPSYEEVQGPAGLTPCRWAPCHPPPPPFRRQRLFPTAPGWFGGGGGGLRSACRRVEGFALPLCARTRVHTWERMCVCARVCIPAGAA